MYEANFSYEGATDKVYSYQILSSNHGWKLGDTNDIINGLFPQIVSLKMLSMKVIKDHMNESGIEGLRDAHFNKVPFDMTINLGWFSFDSPASLSATLQLSKVRITSWHAIKEVSTAYENTEYARKSGFLISMEAAEAKAASSYKPNPFFLTSVMAGQR